MFDLQNQRPCDHKIVDETLSVQGLSPDYYAYFRYGSNLNTKKIELREWSATEYLDDYVYLRDGISHWTLSGDGKRLDFSYPYVEPRPDLYPKNIYFATYICPKSSCPKCSGTGIMNDIALSSAGWQKTVEGSTKLSQLVMKALRSVRGSNKFHPTYGSTLEEAIGTKATVMQRIKLQQDVKDAVEFLIDEQATISGLPANELILRVDDVTVRSTDPRTFELTLKILDGEYNVIRLTTELVT